MTAIAEPVSRHSLNHEPGGYVTAWSGDLNPDLPTRILPLAKLSRPTNSGFSTPSVEILQAVLEGLWRL
ncbi:hypothetical protein GCM10011581_36890 [Saccharopolyspora subtropica]|uniref:Uncharacterized protein n=1 Tax=Saccharopolyspora thermophila TaxID=89367 RepID=A0A917NGM3_9PSEU|nr:hypothetical protein GCM10011581_36890 [Saccharopolyspora subtropica]